MSRINSSSKTTLETKAELLLEKRKNDPLYLFSKSEQRTIKKYEKKKEKEELNKIKKETKKIELENRKFKKQKKKKTTICKTVQETIPFDQMYHDKLKGALIEICGKNTNCYSKTIEMTDINYHLAREDEQVKIFSQYGQMLNYFSEDTTLQVTIANQKIPDNYLENKILFPHREDGYDKYRDEFNEVLLLNKTKGKNDIQQRKFLTISYEADTPLEGYEKFKKTEIEVIKSLEKVGSIGKIATYNERLEFLHDFFRKDNLGNFSISPEIVEKRGVNVKDYIAPATMKFKKKYFKIEDEYYTCGFINNLPASLSDDLIKDLSDNDFESIVTLYIQPIEANKGTKLVRRQLTAMNQNKIEQEKKAIQNGYSPETIGYELSENIAHAEELYDDITNKNQKMFFVSILVMVNGASEKEAQANLKELSSKANKYSCQLNRLDWQQEEAFKTILPVGRKTLLEVSKTLTTESTAVFMPFSSQELFQLDGFFYGLNQTSKKMILINRKSFKTPSGFLIGSPGSGKSFAGKREMLYPILKDTSGDLIVLDPENEYERFLKAFGASIVDISPQGEYHINIMEMSENYGLDEKDQNAGLKRKKEKAISKKSDFLINVIESMISINGNSLITPAQKTIIDKAIKESYRIYLETFNKNDLPTLKELKRNLKNFEGELEKGDMDELILGLDFYINGQMNLFAHKSNVEYNSRIISFNLRDLGNQIKNIGLLVVLDFIWNRMIENFKEGKRTYLYVDEIHTMFKSKYSADFLKQLYKRGRKYGLIVTGITQNVEDLLRSESARGMISNSEYICMLKQSPEDLEILKKMLNLSEEQAEYITNATPGSGVLFAEGNIIPFEDDFPKNTELFKLIDTDFKRKEEKKNEII